MKYRLFRTRWFLQILLSLCGIAFLVSQMNKMLIRRKHRAALRYLSSGNPIIVNEKDPDSRLEEQFFNFLRFVSYPCRDMVRLGNKDSYMPRTIDSLGWEICLDTPYQLQEPCTVYSFGLPDISNWKFEDEIQSSFGCKIHTFDPGFPNLKDHQRTDLISFHKLGIAGRDGRDDALGWEIKTLSSIRRLVGQDGIIDILKLDIDGKECDVISNIVQSGESQRIKQIAMRLTFSLNRRSYMKTYTALQSLEKAGFRKFYTSFGDCLANSPYSKKMVPRCLELYFININSMG